MCCLFRGQAGYEYASVPKLTPRTLYQPGHLLAISTKLFNLMDEIVHHYTFGLYSAFRACKAIALRSSLQSKLTVDTIFLS